MNLRRGMQRCLVLLWTLLLTAACHVDRAPMDASHAERVVGINTEIWNQIDQSNREWARIAKNVKLQERYLIKVEVETGKPVELVVTGYVDAWESCEAPAIVDPSLPPVPPTPEAINTCQGVVRADYFRAIGGRYFKADFDWVDAQRAVNPDLELETLCAQSHNEKLTAEITTQLAEIKKHRRAFADSMNEIRHRRVAQSEQERDQDIEAANQRRRSAWAAALQGFSQGMQNASQATSRPATASSYGGSSAYAPRASEPSGCSSDFSCGIGKKCVKNYYSSSGVCMNAVNEYGVPSVKLPDLNSVGPNMPSKKSCTLGTSCPVGFRCDLKSGVCIR